MCFIDGHCNIMRGKYVYFISLCLFYSKRIVQKKGAICSVIDMCVSVFVCVPMCQYVLKEDI